MCGIAGICRYKGNGTEDIMAMNSKMYHRGPDSGGYWIDEQEKVVLGHRRLAIVDLSENGAQPMESPSGRYIICFNGEIYNCKAILKKMEAEGNSLRLKGSSDTEVIVNAIEWYGLEKTLSLMKGMFAIALWDREEKKIYLMRDRVGEKPLYYGFVNGSFVFASDIASIEAIFGFKNKINEEVLPLYFQYGYIPAPYSVYQDIYKLKPGCCLTAEKDFRDYRIQNYWSMEEIAVRGQQQLFEGTRQEAADRLEVLLKDAIRGQMMADVALGAFLSGGIDSALVVSLMQSVSSQKIRTFTIGFEEEAYNEAKSAREIAEHLGTEHTELYVGKKEAMQAIQSIPDAYTEPFADSSQIPTMLVSKMTREHVTVSLSGDAGDELFCGYNTYRVAASEMAALEKKVGFLPEGLRTKAGVLCQKLSGPRTQRLYKVGNYFTMHTAEEAHRRMGLEEARYGYLSRERKRLPHGNSVYRDGLFPECENNLMLMDLLQYHVDDILVKVDRAGMFYSLETRIPLLDKDVVEFAWRLPLSYKLDEGVTKRVMRDVLYRYVPKEMMERPKKGFSMPIQKWLSQGEMKEWAEDILQTGRRRYQDSLNTKMIDVLWSEYRQQGKWTDKLWYVLMLEQWLISRKI